MAFSPQSYHYVLVDLAKLAGLFASRMLCLLLISDALLPHLPFSRMRVLCFDHLEQRFHDVLSSGIAMVTSRKEALGVERERRLQLHQHRPQRIEMDIHNMRSGSTHTLSKNYFCV